MGERDSVFVRNFGKVMGEEKGVSMRSNRERNPKVYVWKFGGEVIKVV